MKDKKELKKRLHQIKGKIKGKVFEAVICKLYLKGVKMTEKTEERENVANEVINKVLRAIAMTLKLSDEDISIEKGKEKENFYTIFRNKIEIGNLVVAKDGGVVVAFNSNVIAEYERGLVLMYGDFGNALRRDIGKTQEEKLENIVEEVEKEIKDLGLEKTVLIGYYLN